MERIQNAAKMAVHDKLQRLIRNDIQKVINRTVEYAIESVTNDLKFKIIPVDRHTFKVEAFWDPQPVDIKGN